MSEQYTIRKRTAHMGVLVIRPVPKEVAREPQASASGRDLIRDCLSILLACGIDPLRAGRNNRVAYVSYQWPLE